MEGEKLAFLISLSIEAEEVVLEIVLSSVDSDFRSSRSCSPAVCTFVSSEVAWRDSLLRSGECEKLILLMEWNLNKFMLLRTGR